MHNRQKLDLLVSNFIEYEASLLELAAEYLAHVDMRYEHVVRSGNVVINRRILNLLASCISYPA